MHAAKAGRLDQNIRVNFGLVSKRIPRSVSLSISTPLHPISPSMKHQDPALCEIELRHGLFHASGRPAGHRICRA
jgi:hypothetical protein